MEYHLPCGPLETPAEDSNRICTDTGSLHVTRTKRLLATAAIAAAVAAGTASPAMANVHVTSTTTENVHVTTTENVHVTGDGIDSLHLT